MEKKETSFYKEEIGNSSRVEVKTILHIDGEDEPRVESLEGKGVAGIVITPKEVRSFVIGLNIEDMLVSFRALMDLIIKAVAEEQGQEPAALLMLTYLDGMMGDVKNGYFTQKDGGDKDVIH